MSKETIVKFKTSDFVNPKESELRWIFITQPGKEGPKGDNGEEGKRRFVADLVMKTDSEGCKKLSAFIDDYWKDHKPKGVKCKSKGYAVVKEKTGEVDDEDVPIYRDTDETAFSFWTGTHWKDGKENNIDIYNAKGKKVSLGDKKIGNGSQGSISGAMDIYKNGVNNGVSLYLNAIQLTKFVEFSQDADFDSFDDEEDAFEGVDTEFDEVSQDAPKPRL